jgi:hypothetical protein
MQKHIQTQTGGFLRSALPLLACLLTACTGAPEVLTVASQAGTGQAGKNDSGWVGADSYEVEAIVTGMVQHPGTGEYRDLAYDAALQSQLIDLQLKFIKTTAEANGWRLNQLNDSVVVTDLVETDAGYTVYYEATVDMLGRLSGYGVPELEDIDTRFTAAVPAVPTDFSYSTIEACSKVDDRHSPADYNFHYYFSPNQPECELVTNKVELQITKVFPRPTVYPEYDRLLQPIDDARKGFYAALVPNRGDKDPKSRFNAHASALENNLGLRGEVRDDGAFVRYEWEQGGVVMVIDLYDPTDLPWMSDFESHFRKRLGQYTLVHYNGHSSYGSKHLVDDPDAFTDQYQIISIHSCQSYAYFSRQVFRAKATEADPSGMDAADILATGKSSYPSGAPPTITTILRGLMDGMVAVESGRPGQAPSWNEVVAGIKASTWGDILYGMAGVRENTWRP